MREFVTRVSDYISERWNDPARRESRLSIVLIGAVAIVIIVLLLLLLWSYVMQEKEAGVSEQEEAARTVSTQEEQTIVYMADDEQQEAFRQEYLTSIQYLGDRVEELLQSMTQVQDGLSESMKQCEAEDSSLSERINEFYQTVSEIVQNLQETQVKLYDLTDIVQILDEEKLPLVQEQMQELRQDVEKVQTDITDVYTRIDELAEEDEQLWAQLGSIQSGLEVAMNENIAEVNDQMNVLELQMQKQKDELQVQVNNITSQTLKYHYDEASGTLYLEPVQSPTISD